MCWTLFLSVCFVCLDFLLHFTEYFHNPQRTCLNLLHPAVSFIVIRAEQINVVIIKKFFFQKSECSESSIIVLTRIQDCCHAVVLSQSVLGWMTSDGLNAGLEAAALMCSTLWQSFVQSGHKAANSFHFTSTITFSWHESSALFIVSHALQKIIIWNCNLNLFGGVLVSAAGNMDGFKQINLQCNYNYNCTMQYKVMLIHLFVFANTKIIQYIIFIVSSGRSKHILVQCQTTSSPRSKSPSMGCPEQKLTNGALIGALLHG